MKPTNPVYIGAPLTGDEARFLCTLAQRYAGSKHLILANFELAGQQIDFVLVTSIGATLIELKNFSRAVFGDLNGSWHLLSASGAKDGIGNPYKQALAQKFALSDAMRSFQGRAADVPPAVGKGFFADFAAYVCVSPAIAPGSRVTRGDAKVRVRGAADMFSEIDAGGPASAWQSDHWARFAVEHLKLDCMTVEAATETRQRAAPATKQRPDRVRSAAARKSRFDRGGSGDRHRRGVAAARTGGRVRTVRTRNVARCLRAVA